MINVFRRLLIRIGKVLPFALCFIILIAYVESVVSLYFKDYLIYNEFVTLNTPISFFIAKFFEYDVLTIFLATILSISVQTCMWNKISLLYVTFHFLSRGYIEAQELEPTTIYIICAANIIASGYLTFKGLTILLTK